MMQANEAEIVERPAFRAAGMKWEGTFAEAGAGGIRAVQREFKRRLHDIRDAVRPDVLLGLSYHACPGKEGFAHYAAVEIAGTADIPAGLELVEVPALAYAKCEHRKGEAIDRSYANLYAWIEENGYAAHSGDLTHFEEYPMAQDPYDPDPAFTILVPVEPKRS